MPTPVIPALRPLAAAPLAAALQPLTPPAAGADDAVSAPALRPPATGPADEPRLLRDDDEPRPVRDDDEPRLLRDGNAPRPANAADSPQPDAPAPRLLDTAALPRHVDRLYRAALALCGDRVDAEDLVQEVCLRALAKPRLIRGADDLPYLMQMLRNVFYNQCRSQAGRRTTPVEPETLEVVPAGRRHDPELGLLVREVHQAIAALPPHYRDVVVAVDVVGLAYADAAGALGIPVGTVMSRLHRAREAVARAVGEQSAAA